MSSHAHKKLKWLKAVASLCLGFGLFSGSMANPVELRLAVWDGDEALRVLRGEIKTFEQNHPGVTVHLENIDYRIYFQKLLTQYAAGTAVDVAMLDPQNFQQYARRGALLDLTPLAKSTPGFKLDDYYKEILAAFRMGGELYVLPRDIAPIGLIYYNKRMFQEAGLTQPDGTWTWDFRPRPELGSKCFTYCMEKLTRRAADGHVVRWGFAPSWTGALTDTMAFSLGARYVDNPSAFTRMNIDDPRFVQAFDFVAALATKDHWMPSQAELTSVVQSSAVDLFINQRVAMYQCGIWDVPHIRAALKPGSPQFFDWDITLAPGHIDSVTGKVNRAAPTGGSGYGILSSTEHPKEAWELVQWMSGEHVMRAMARAGLAQPAIHRLAISADWLPGPNTPLEERYPENRIVTDEAVPYVVFPPTAEYWTEVSSLAFAKTEPIYLGTMSAKDALAEASRVSNARLAAILKQKRLGGFNWWVGGSVAFALILGVLAWVYKPEIGKWKSAGARRESLIGHLFVAPWILGALTLAVGPMIFSLLMSFSEWDIIAPAKWMGLGNYHEAFFEDSRFWGSVRVTAVYSAVAVPTGIILALALAVLLNQKVMGTKIFRTFFYMPALASVVASALLWMKIFQPTGLLNTLLFGAQGTGGAFGLGAKLGVNGQPPNWLGDERLSLSALMMMSLWGVGGGMVILLAGLQGIPEHYYEAARLDGASAWLRFKSVTLPLLSPALFFTLVTGVIGSLQTFVPAFVMTQGGPNDSTRFYMYHLYDLAFGSLRMGYASALAWVLFIVILAVTIVQFRLNRLVYYEGDAR